MTLWSPNLPVAVTLCASLAGISAGSSSAGEPARVEALAVDEVAARLGQRPGRPSIVMLYATTCPRSRHVFPAFVALANEYRDRGVDLFVFSVDEEENADWIPVFLSNHGASFAAVRVRPWASGSLARAMRPVGISIGETWTAPLIAVRDHVNRIVTQGQGVTDLSEVREALSRLAR